MTYQWAQKRVKNDEKRVKKWTSIYSNFDSKIDVILGSKITTYLHQKNSRKNLFLGSFWMALKWSIHALFKAIKVTLKEQKKTITIEWSYVALRWFNCYKNQRYFYVLNDGNFGPYWVLFLSLFFHPIPPFSCRKNRVKIREKSLF